MASKRLDLPSICDICGNARSTRKHQKCSRIRQHRKTEEWAALMAEKAAIRKAKDAVMFKHREQAAPESHPVASTTLSAEPASTLVCHQAREHTGSRVVP